MKEPLHQSGLFDQPAKSSGVKASLSCLKCGHKDTVLSPGKGPHHARIDCPKCGAWRWMPKPRPEQKGGEDG
jgi:hypothetical protein